MKRFFVPVDPCMDATLSEALCQKCDTARSELCNPLGVPLVCAGASEPLLANCQNAFTQGPDPGELPWIHPPARLNFARIGPESWPIEIGLAWIEHDTVRTWSSLIRPTADWSMDGWDYNSAQMHGISAEELSTAPEARLVAEAAAKLINGKLICSDAPNFDYFWAEMLFAELPRAFAIRIADAHRVLNLLLDGTGRDRAYDKLRRSAAPHRAGPDAERYASALLHGLMT